MLKNSVSEVKSVTKNNSSSSSSTATVTHILASLTIKENHIPDVPEQTTTQNFNIHPEKTDAQYRRGLKRKLARETAKAKKEEMAKKSPEDKGENAKLHTQDLTSHILESKKNDSDCDDDWDFVDDKDITPTTSTPTSRK